MKLNKKFLVALSGVAMLALVATTGCKKEAPASSTALVDGTYTKVAEEFDEMGYKYELTIEVKDGAIVAANYDATNKEGQKKSDLSLNGEYVMTEDGPTWAAQSDALVDYLIEHQTYSEVPLNDEGKTDAISGVSINVSSFVEYLDDCLSQAAAK